jgi:CheY-like chemotaxis protein
MTPSLQRILFVEDDLDIQAVARMALEAVGGFTVEVCDSGHDAIETAPTFQPDLILLDVMMPGMDGPTTFGALRAIPQTSCTPVIFMTAKIQNHEVERYKTLGAAGVIAKPFDPMQLSAQITAIWTSCHATF